MLDPYCFAQNSDRKFAHCIEHRKFAAATTATIAIEIRLSDAIIHITIIGINTKTALKATNKHL
jgi:hypothetical protein